MKKKIVRLTESDLEKLVQRIIKEEDEMDQNTPEDGGEMDQNTPEDGGENEDNPQDVKNFLEAMKKYFMNKYPRFANKINTRNEKAMLLAALAQELGVDTNMINMAKGELKKSGLNK